MSIDKINYHKILNELKPYHARLVAVSKMKTASDIQALYDLGQRDFGENYVQELLEKQEALPKDIQWHFIGHLQTNKVKYILPFIHLIHGVDSEKLLKEISKQAVKLNKKVDCLLQIDISNEETKFGMDSADLTNIMESYRMGKYPAVEIKGLMGMAALDAGDEATGSQFEQLKTLFMQYPEFSILSMGMSGDYELALKHGSTMVRIGSLVFGRRLSF